MRFLLLLFISCVISVSSHAQSIYGIRSAFGYGDRYNTLSAGLYYRSLARVSVRPEFEFMNYMIKNKNSTYNEGTYIQLPVLFSVRPFKRVSIYTGFVIPLNIYRTHYFRGGIDYRCQNLVFGYEFDLNDGIDVSDDDNDGDGTFYTSYEKHKLTLSYVFTNSENAIRDKIERKEQRRMYAVERKEKKKDLSKMYQVRSHDSVTTFNNKVPPQIPDSIVTFRGKVPLSKVTRIRALGVNSDLRGIITYGAYMNARFNIIYSVQSTGRTGRLRELKAGYGYNAIIGVEESSEGYFFNSSYLFGSHRTGNYLQGYIGLKLGAGLGDVYGANDGGFIPYMEVEFGLGPGYYLLDNNLKFNIHAGIGTLGIGSGATLCYAWKSYKPYKRRFGMSAK